MEDKHMHFYTCAVGGGNTICYSVEKPSYLHELLSFALEQPIDVHQRGWVTHEFRSSDVQGIKTSAVLDLGVGSPPVLISQAMVLSKGDDEYFPDWLKERLSRLEFQGEIWWVFHSKQTGRIFIRTNQPAPFSEGTISSIGIAFARPDQTI